MTHVVPALVVATAWQGCALETFETAAETDSILTVRRSEFDFAAQATFSIDSEVVDLGDLVDDPIELTDRFDARVLGRLRANLFAAGWTEVPFPETPGDVPDSDVVMLVGKVASNNWTAYGGCLPWGWGAVWWCAPAIRTVNYRRGSVVIAMVDPDDVATQAGEDVIPGVWTAGINGLLESSTRRIEARIDANIDQAFAQSPYLRLGEAE